MRLSCRQKTSPHRIPCLTLSLISAILAALLSLRAETFFFFSSAFADFSPPFPVVDLKLGVVCVVDDVGLTTDDLVMDKLELDDSDPDEILVVSSGGSLGDSWTIGNSGLGAGLNFLAGEAALAEAFAAKAMAYFEGLSALFGAGEGLDTGFSMI